MTWNASILGESDWASWDALVASHPLGSALFTRAARDWWRVGGWTLRPIGIRRDGQLLAGAAAITKPVPLSPWTLARVVGLLPSAEDAAGTVEALIGRAVAAAWLWRAMELEVRSSIPQGVAVGGLDCHDAAAAAMAVHGFAAGKAQCTYLKRIGFNDAVLLNSFSSKCRRDIRKGIREGVTVVRADSEELLNALGSAEASMSRRKGWTWAIRPVQFEAFRPLWRCGWIQVFAALRGGKVCNLALVDALGVPRYTVGAITPEGLSPGGPPTGQVLHYEIMKWFRDRGKTHYDLGGVPGPVPVEGDESFTVWRFKHEFSGTFVSFLPRCRRPLGLAGRCLAPAARRLGLLPR